MTSYSERNEDAWCHQNLPIPEHGFYVDVGCAFPTIGNNCQWLRERGWNGLNIDGNPGYSEHWGAWSEPQAKFIAAVISHEPEVKFRTSCNPMLCRITHEGQPTPARTLNSIMEEHGVGRVDFLSLDLEGSEYEAATTLDLERYGCPIIIAEYRTAPIEQGEVITDYRLRDYLVPLGYEQRHDSGINLVFFKP